MFLPCAGAGSEPAGGEEAGVQGQRPQGFLSIQCLLSTRRREGRRGLIGQRRVRATMVVLILPVGCQHLGLAQIGEQFRVKQFIAQLAVEALGVAVLPGAARLDGQRV